MESMNIRPDLMVHAKGAGSMAGVEGLHVGTVDHVDGGYIKLKKSDSKDGMHHWIPLSMVDHVDDKAVYLNATEDELNRKMLNEEPQLH